ncbi:hypothetical protein DFJ73DRAFT_923826 [Zopfochytrium polystomum]|nr:hypothetical protein DFJ73DRAFT_923826 [Zopfochytrium polystomum]
MSPPPPPPPPPPPSSSIAAAATDASEYVIEIDHDALYRHKLYTWAHLLALGGCVGLLFLPCIASSLRHAAKSTLTVVDASGLLSRRTDDEHGERDRRLVELADVQEVTTLTTAVCGCAEVPLVKVASDRETRGMGEDAGFVGTVVWAPRRPSEVQEVVMRRRMAAVLGPVAGKDSEEHVAEFYATTPEEAVQRLTVRDHSVRYVSVRSDRWIALDKVRDVLVRGRKTADEPAGTDVEIVIGGDEANVRVVGVKNALGLREVLLGSREALRMRLALAAGNVAGGEGWEVGVEKAQGGGK